MYNVFFDGIFSVKRGDGIEIQKSGDFSNQKIAFSIRSKLHPKAKSHARNVI